MTTERPEDNTTPKKSFSFAPRPETITDGTRTMLETDRQRKGQRYLALSGVVILSIIGLSFFSLTKEDDIKIQVEAPIKQEENGALVLEGVTYKGVTSKGNDFIVLANKATELPDQPDLIKLSEPRARVDTDSGNPMTIRSNQGLFFQTEDRVNLDGRVVIVRPDIGYTILTEQAVADLGTGTMTSDTNVRGFSPQAQVTAGGMIIRENGKDVIFKGKSVLTLNQN